MMDYISQFIGIELRAQSWYEKMMSTTNLTADGEIQGQKSKTIQFAVAHYSQKCIGTLHFLYCVINSLEEINLTKVSLQKFGLPSDKIIELSTDKKSESWHYDNIKNGCVYIISSNTHRFRSVNYCNYEAALTRWAAEEPQMKRRSIAVIDDCYDILSNKDLSKSTFEEIEAYQNRRAARDVDHELLEKTFSHVTRIAGTWTSLLGSIIDEAYIYFEPPEKYTNELELFKAQLDAKHYLGPDGSKVTDSREGPRPSIFDDSAVLKWCQIKGGGRFIMGAKIGISETLSTWETAYGTARDCHQKQNLIGGYKLGVLLVAGTNYDADNRCLTKDKESEVSKFYDISYDGQEYQQTPILCATHNDALQHMCDKYHNRVIVLNQLNLFKQAKTICSSDGQTVMVVFYLPHVPQYSDGIVQVSQRLAGTFDVHPKRHVITSKEVFERIQKAEKDVQSVRGVIQLFHKTKDDEKVLEKFSDPQAYFKHLLSNHLTMATNKPSNPKHKQSQDTKKNEYFKSFPDEAALRKDDVYGHAPIHTMRVELSECFDEPLPGQSIDIDWYLSGENQHLWVGRERQKRILQSIRKDRQPHDTTRNITKYHTQYKDKDYRHVGDETFCRVMADFSQGHLVIIANKWGLEDLRYEAEHLYVAHSIDGSIKLYNGNGTYSVKDRHETIIDN